MGPRLRGTFWVAVTGAVLWGLVSMPSVGCGPALPTPQPPQGKGWYTFAQGFNDFTVASTSSSSGGTTTTTTTTSSSYSNVSQHEARTTDEVRRTLHVGRNVSDYKFNPDLTLEVLR
jgi:hypothetical protein